MKSLKIQGQDRPSVQDVRAACDRISASPVFENSDRMIRFLRFVVEKSLAGEADQLKEYVLGVEVFDRAESFDPKTDTIVRVEARRLRKKLREYYETQTSDPVRIDVPTPGYVPTFEALEADAPPVAAASVGVPGKLVIGGIIVGIVLLAGGGWWFTRRPAAVSGIDSIAVLPFSDMSAAKDQEYFCDGFTEELISALASTSGLRVVARTSAFAFKGKAGDIREIGRALNAGVVLEGSVRRSGGTARITAQLIRVSDGYHLWSQSYDRKLEDVLMVQEEIAGLIASTLRKQLTPGNRSAAPLTNLEAHDLYLLGRYHWNRMGQGDLQKAVEYFEKAIALQPNSALAYGGLADAYSYMIDLDTAPTAEILPKARAAADRALELDPNSAEAHTARGLVAHELEWDQTRARREFLRAIELNPNYAYGIHWYAHYLEFAGQLNEAEGEMQKALTIDPLSRMFTIDDAMILYKQRRYEEALKKIDRAQQLDPEYVLLDGARAFVYQAQRDWKKALASQRKAIDRMAGDPEAIAFMAQTEALSGDVVSARRNLAIVRQAAKKAYVPDCVIALAEFAVGEREQGRASLRKSIDGHSGLLVWLKTAPVFDQVKSDPEGLKLLETAGGPLPQH